MSEYPPHRQIDAKMLDHQEGTLRIIVEWKDSLGFKWESVFLSEASYEMFVWDALKSKKVAFKVLSVKRQRWNGDKWLSLDFPE